jgi:hypothetical protein
MSRAKDQEVEGVGIKSREHPVKESGTAGRKRYPFKAMVRNDYFCVGSFEEAVKVRNALKTFYRTPTYAGRMFSVRPSSTDATIWVIRRVA